MATTHYDRVAIALHWLMGLCIILMLFLGLTMEDYEPISRRFAAINFHKALGITLLALAVFRLVWRLLHKAPPLPEHMNKLEKFAAKASHFFLYGFMIAIPLTGWLMTSAAAKYQITWFGLFVVPFLPLPEDSRKAIGGFSHDAHEWLAYGLIALLVAHVLAALKHHFYDRDDVLTHMVPILKRR